MKRRFAILCVPLLALSCSAHNPLTSGLASGSAPVSASGCLSDGVTIGTGPDCQYRFNFQCSASVSAWTNPGSTWCPPSDITPSPTLVWSGTHVTCGNGAMEGTLDMTFTESPIVCPGAPPDGGTFYYAARGILETTFPTMQNDTNAYVTMDIYFAQPPPAALGLAYDFIDDKGIWIPPVDSAHFAMSQGWNHLSESFVVDGAAGQGDITHVAGFVIQFEESYSTSDLGGPSYDSNFWIGDINW